MKKFLNRLGMSLVESVISTLLIGGAAVNSRHAGYVAMAGQEDLSKIRNNVFFMVISELKI